jgi:hypothetical protein
VGKFPSTFKLFKLSVHYTLHLHIRFPLSFTPYLLISLHTPPRNVPLGTPSFHPRHNLLPRLVLILLPPTNPLSIWNGGMLYSPLARKQYADRHEGNVPQVAGADLAFSGHALILAGVALGQVWYYRQRTIGAILSDRHQESGREETDPLLPDSRGARGKGEDRVDDPAIPSIPCQIGLGLMTLFATAVGIMVYTGKYNLQWLDWLYAVSMIKLAISAVKYAPQIWLNWQLRRVEGMAVEGMICVSLFRALKGYS